MSERPILYSVSLSPPCRTVLMVAEFIKLELDVQYVNLFVADHLKEDYLKKNPSHTVPTLTDEGNSIWESAPICTYLIGKYGPKECSLYPTDLLTRARIDQRLYYNAGVLFPKLRAGSVAVFFQNAPEMPSSVLDNAYEALDHLEVYLKADDFLVGNSLTLADLAVITTLQNLQIWLPVDAIKYPRTLAWVDRVTEAFPGFKEMNEPHMIEYLAMYKSKLASNQKA